MAKKKQNTAFNVQVADFIRNHKKACTAIDDEVTEKQVIPYDLESDWIHDHLEHLTDGRQSITDKDETPSWRNGEQRHAACLQQYADKGSAASCPSGA